MKSSPAGMYRDAGVNIDAGNEAVLRIGPHAKRTRIPGVLSDIGGFGGCFSLKPYGFKNAVLVAGADGVGTKLKIAFEMGIH
ncbi:MAG: phosphoribosylformylglycinamidine cyclo-ligase, partial [Bacillota bacterium]